MSRWTASSSRPLAKILKRFLRTVVVTNTAITVPEITIPPLKMASLKDAKAVVEKGAQRAVHRARTRGPPICIINHGINAFEDSDSDCDMDKWIFPTSSGGLNNWRAKDFVPIISSKSNYLFVFWDM